MHAFADEFVEIKITWLEGILAGVRSREREKILDDMREPRGLLVKHFQRLAVLLQRTCLLRKSDFRFAAQNRNWRPQFVRRVGHEALLPFE